MFVFHKKYVKFVMKTINYVHTLMSIHCIISRLGAVATSLLLFSCGGDADTSADMSPEVSANVRARELRLNGAPASAYMPLQEEAVRKLHEGTSTDDPVDVLSQMGYFLMRSGDYMKAIEYFQEAADSINTERKHRDIRGDITLFGNMSTLYARLGMIKEALDANTRAINISRANGKPILGDLYSFRGGIHESAGNLDSSYYYARRAIEILDSIPLRSTKEELTDFYLQNMYVRMIEHHDQYPDSLNTAIKVLERIETGPNGSATARFAIGLGYVETGNAAKGLPMMEAAAHEFEKQQWVESIHWAYKLLLDVYGKLGITDKATALYPEYNRLNDSITASERSNAVIAADIRYKASRKEAEIKQLNATLISVRQRMVVTWTLIALAAITVIAVVYRIIKKNRSKRQHLNRYICELLTSQEELNSRLQTLISEIDCSSIEHAKGVITPSLIKNNDVGKFRRTFELLYPEWLGRLRAQAPKLTQNDELLCMLIYLKQTPEEISNCLSITRMSLNSARYRIRGKLGLPKETDLDQYIQSL